MNSRPNQCAVFSEYSFSDQVFLLLSWMFVPKDFHGLHIVPFAFVLFCVHEKKMSRGSHELEVKESVTNHSFSSLHWQVGERSDWPVLSAFLLHDWSVLSITLGKLLPHTCDVLDPKVEYCHCTDFFKDKNRYRLNSRHHLHSIVLKCIQCKKSCKIFSYFVIVFVCSCIDYLCHYLACPFLAVSVCLL